MASRDTFTSASPPPVGGPAFVDQVAGHMGTMYQYLPLNITLTSGSEPDDLTGTVDPPLPGSGLAQGMSFWLNPNVDNAGAMTIAIGAEAAVGLVRHDGTGFGAGEVEAVGRYLLYFDGTNMRVVSHVTTGDATSGVEVDTFTADGTLAKPVGFPDNGLVIVEGWGGGGGGEKLASGTASGGHGGAFARQIFVGSAFASSEAVSIGDGGASRSTNGNGNDGGNTTLGSVFSARGGPGGASSGPASVGTEAGAGANSDAYQAGAGGGNGGSSSSPGGTSDFAGDGGAGGSAGGSNGTDGLAPSGGGGGAVGGGTTGAGARGELKVTWVWP